MTPTEQTRLESIKAVHAKTIPQGIYQADMRFLLSLLSQETKRADEAEAVAEVVRKQHVGHKRRWLAVMGRGESQFNCANCASLERLDAVRRGREGR